MRPLIFAFVLAACGSSSGDKDGELPGPLRSMAGDYEITDWSGTTFGVTRHRVASPSS